MSGKSPPWFRRWYLLVTYLAVAAVPFRIYPQAIPPPLPSTVSSPQRTPAALPPTPQAAPPAIFQPRSVSTLPFAVQMHGSAVIGNRLYVLGGSVDGVGHVDMVWAATVDREARVSPWAPQTPLPDLRHNINNAVEVVNSRIYIAGGSVAEDRKSTDTGISNINDVIYTTVQANGTLGTWARSLPFGEPRSLIATANDGRALYITGGATHTVPRDEVLAADFMPDGSLGPWRQLGTLPQPLWFHGAAILEGRLYIWGGLTQSRSSSATDAVWSAEILPTSRLGSWRAEPPLPIPIYSSANRGFNDYIVSIGGRLAGGQPVNDIFVSKLDGGRVSPWRRLGTNLDTQYFHGLGLDEGRGWIFITGGRSRPDLAQFGRIIQDVRAFQLQAPREAQSPTLTALGFMDLQTARNQAQASGRRILLYFRSPEVPSCLRFEDELQGQKMTQDVLSGYHLAVVDVSRNPQLSYDFGLFKVPAFAILGPGGTPLKTSVAIRTTEQLRDFIK